MAAPLPAPTNPADDPDRVRAELVKASKRIRKLAVILTVAIGLITGLGAYIVADLLAAEKSVAVAWAGASFLGMTGLALVIEARLNHA